MRRLIRLATYLYPAAWRKRYAREFDALLEDVGPRWIDVLNVLGGALKMQLKQGSFWNVAICFAVGGMLVASAWSWFGVPDRYQAMGVLAMPPAATPMQSKELLVELQQTLLSRSSLKQVIDKQDLYASERSSIPLEDVIEKMRTEDILINIASSDAFSIHFSYPDRSKAESTLKDLVARLQSKGELKVLTISERQVAPNRRWRIALSGLGAGLLTGMVIAGLTRMRRKTIMISGACGMVGFLLAGAISFAVPNNYVSTAVVIMPDGRTFAREAQSRKALAAIIEKHQLYRGERAKKSTDQLVDTMRGNFHVAQIDQRGPAAVLVISFVYPERGTPNSVIADVIQRYKKPLGIAVLDEPSLSEQPISPNRYIIAMLGLSLGLVSGAAFARVHRPAMA